MISHENKLIYVRLGKNGSTSVKETLEQQMPDIVRVGRVDKHATANAMRKSLGDEIWNNYFKFTVVRNPWDRLVSTYLYHRTQRDYGTSTKKYFRAGMRHECHVFPTLDQYAKHHKYIDRQVDYILDDDSNVIVDKILYCENLENELNDLLTSFGCDSVSLRKANASKNRKHDYREFYTEESKEAVRKKYKDDIDMFNYSFD